MEQFRTAYDRIDMYSTHGTARLHETPRLVQPVGEHRDRQHRRELTAVETPKNQNARVDLMFVREDRLTGGNTADSIGIPRSCSGIVATRTTRRGPGPITACFSGA
ncbi:hypothetical protein [Actinoplanes xinjiangensis]|uniref:hypothetical protein n=1 Tax=Actinoplanes xinjiangensis TaxID=512350 RepID=UPI003412FDB6